uniref:Uncharacterized protein n=1 Tax=Timema douglasi TaxID=61478 RepID=A0A7R8ZCG7_TIMDO|nr:unnamed protein product [Timema douglasi]
MFRENSYWAARSLVYLSSLVRGGGIHKKFGDQQQIFQESPPLPPSAAQAVQRAAETTSFVSSLRRLMGNPGYILLLVSYGINVGVFYAISTLLNQVILSHYENATSDAGRIGLTIVLAGMVGSAISGFVLDKTHKFNKAVDKKFTCSFYCDMKNVSVKL